jgi:hypothetical protein
MVAFRGSALRALNDSLVIAIRLPTTISGGMVREELAMCVHRPRAAQFSRNRRMHPEFYGAFERATTQILDCERTENSDLRET